MHDLSQYTTGELLERYEALERGPLNFYEAVGYRCGCDIDCPYDDLSAVEAELVRKELRVVR